MLYLKPRYNEPCYNEVEVYWSYLELRILVHFSGMRFQFPSSYKKSMLMGLKWCSNIPYLLLVFGQTDIAFVNSVNQETLQNVASDQHLHYLPFIQ